MNKPESILNKSDMLSVREVLSPFPDIRTLNP